jgi:hypothetical protein
MVDDGKDKDWAARPFSISIKEVATFTHMQS